MILIDKFEKSINYDINYDVVKRKIDNKNTIYYLSSLVENESVNFLIDGMLSKRKNYLNGSVSKNNNLLDITTSFFSGCLIIYDNFDFFIVETRNYPSRSINESESEKSLKGPHDGFNESILTNTALIRRRIKSEKFKCELFKIGKKSKTDITINYIDDLASKSLLLKIKRRLKEINVDSLVLADKALAEIIFDQNYQIYPKVRFTERPDIAAIHLLKGYIVLLVDTSSSCIIVPTTFFELNEQLEEYQLPPFVSSFNRLFRFLCFFIGVYLLPIWFLLCLDNKNAFKTIIILQNIDRTTLFLQVLSIQIFLNAIRLASFNSTSILSTTMSLFASIILSDVAIKTGLLSSEVVFYAALSSICTYAISNYETSRAMALWNIILTVSVGLFFKIGFIIFATIMFISMVTIHSFDISYLYPFIPFNFKELLFKFYKLPYRKKNKIK